jgi:AraC family transcriptional regulator
LILLVEEGITAEGIRERLKAEDYQVKQVDLRLFRHVSKITARYSSTLQAVDRKLDAAMKFAQKNFRRSPTLDEIAQHSGLSMCYLSRLFTARFKTTPKKVMMELQIQEAKRLLAQGLQPHQVAVLLGFGTSSHFGNRFRSTTGMTPTEWAMRQSRGGSSAANS